MKPPGVGKPEDRDCPRESGGRESGPAVESAAWKSGAPRAGAPAHSVTKNSVASIRRHNYLAIMERFTFSSAAKCLAAMLMSLSLIVTVISAAVAMDHPGHDRAAAAAWTASDSASMGHESHHLPPGTPDAECCEPETTAASGCHMAACCLSELQYADIPAATRHGRSASARAMVTLVGPSIDTSLPERPPRLS